MPDRVIYHDETIQVKGKSVDLRVEINVSAIVRKLGAKAANAKGKRAIEIGGLVEVRKLL